MTKLEKLMMTPDRVRKVIMEHLKDAHNIPAILIGGCCPSEFGMEDHCSEDQNCEKCWNEEAGHTYTPDMSYLTKCLIERMEKAEAVNESLTSALRDIKKNVDDWNLQDYVTIRRLVNAAIRGMEEKMSVSTGVKWQLQRTPYESEIDIVSDKRVIATVEAGEDKEEIAQMIVSAPDMLKALEGAKWLIGCLSNLEHSDEYQDVVKAIRKARGEE